MKNCICKMHMSYNYEKQEWSLHYNPMRCICGPGEYCTLRGRPLSEKTGNIYYDLKVSTIRKDDTLFCRGACSDDHKGEEIFAKQGFSRYL